MACRILVPRPGIEPGALAVKALSPYHWTSRELSMLIVSVKQTSSPVESKEGRPVRVVGLQCLNCHSNRQSGNVIIMMQMKKQRLGL